MDSSSTLRAAFSRPSVGWLVAAGWLAAGPAPALETTASSAFIENRGQLPSEVLYYAPGSPVTTYLTRSGLVLDLAGERGGTGHVVRLAFDGARATGVAAPLAAPLAEPLGDARASFSYFRGNDPAGHHAGIPSYDAVLLRELWPGVDVRVEIDRSGVSLECIAVDAVDAVDLPDAVDAGRAHDALSGLRWEGADRVTSCGDRARTIQTSAGSVREERAERSASLRLTRVDDGRGGREASPQDNPAALVWSTFVGGGSTDTGWDLALDSQDNVVVVGITTSTFFPVTVGAYDQSYNGFGDAFVSKLDASGSTLLWSTFLGGTSLLLDIGLSVAVDPEDHVVVTGYTQSEDFPTTPGAYDQTHNGGPDVFVSKLHSEGSSLLWSTFVGGGLDDIGNSVALDAAGNAIVVGRTLGGGFPVTGLAYDPSENGAEDAFGFMVSNDGANLVWSTFLGGENYDAAQEVLVDADENVLVGGFTSSFDFPTTVGAHQEDYAGGLYDGFVLLLSGSGATLGWSTYLGSTGDFDLVNTLAFDGLGRPLAAGVAGAADFPATAGAYDTQFDGGEDAFVAQLATNGSAVLWSTFLGGSDFGYETGMGLAVDPSGAVLVAGATSSTDFPTTASAFDASFNGWTDAFLAKLSGDGASLLWSSVLGSTLFDAAYAIGLDASGRAVLAGGTGSPDFPVTNGAYDESYNGDDEDVFVSKLDVSENPTPVFLAAFDAQASRNGVVLTWATSLQIDLAGFHVHRSDDGLVWSRLTDVLVAGEGERYRLEDRAVEAGREYRYEIEAVEFSGSATRFGPISITALRPDGVSVRSEPNPATTDARVWYAVPAPGRVRIDLFSADGRLVTRLLDAEVPSGFHSLPLHEQDGIGVGRAGTYFLRIESSSGTATERITIVK